MNQRGGLLFLGICILMIVFDLTHPCQGTSDQQANPGSNQKELYPVMGIKEIIGQWSFVYFKKYQHIVGQLPSPPNFDVIEFIKPNVIKLTSTLNRKTFTGSFTVSAGWVSYVIQHPGQKEPLVQKAGCFLANEGKAMVFQSGETELVFFRSNRILKNNVAGKWLLEINGKKEIMRLGKNGAYAFDTSPVTGVYRLWPSRLGQAMTVFYQEPSHGIFMLIYLYDLKGKHLILTPIQNDQALTEKVAVWKRQ
jgi:hypothetical protein